VDASDDWRTTWASNDLRVGGLLELRIEAMAGGTGFDFVATYTRLEPKKLVEWRMDNGRLVRVEFIPTAIGITVRQTFDAEFTGSEDQERAEWQAVLHSFTRHVVTIAG
jgi:uncharacterized protein YndB with AHSA1/START domain